MPAAAAHGRSRLAAHVTSNCAIVTFTFDLWVNACRATTIEYTCANFGVDGSSRFPFRVRTERQTDVTERPTHAGGYTAGVGNNNSSRIPMM